MMDGPQCTCFQDATGDYGKAMLQKYFTYMNTGKYNYGTMKHCYWGTKNPDHIKA